MNDASSPLPEAIRRPLDDYRRRHRALCLATGALLTLTSVVSFTLLAITLDRLLRLPPLPRAVLLAAIVTTFLFGIARWVAWPAFRRPSDLHVAIRVGRRFPEKTEDLVSAVELSTGAVAGVSRSLVASALEAIAERAGHIDGRSAVSNQQTRIAAAACLAAVTVFAVASLARPRMMVNALHRLVRPDLAVPYYSSVSIHVRPGDAVIARGEALHVVARVAGRRVASTRLEVEADGHAFRRRLKCRDGRAEWTSEPLFDDVRYRLRARDGLTPWCTVRVLPPPALRRLGVRVRPPEYAGGPAGVPERRIEKLDGPLEILAGSAFSVECEPSSRGSDPGFACVAEMRFQGKPLDVRRDDGGLLRSAYFRPAASGTVTIELSDGFGLRSRHPERVKVRVSPDAVPRVAVTRPGRDIVILPGDSIGVAAEAEDEFGVRSLGLMTRIIGGRSDRADDPPWAFRLMLEGGPNTPALASEIDLSTASLGLAPGDVLEYKAVAADYAGEEPERRGESRVYRAAVLSEQEHFERLLERLRDIELDLRRSAAEQEAQSARAGALAQRSDEAASRESRAAAHREREHARHAAAVADEVERLLAESARNPSVPERLLADLARLAQGIREVAAEPMRDVAESFNGAAEAGASEREEWLRNAGLSAEEAARTLKELARIADRMRRASLLEKLADDAARLAERQRELRAATPPLAVKTAGRPPDKLDPTEREEVARLAEAERQVRDGVKELLENVRDAARSLAFSNPSDAAAAEAAAGRIRDHQLPARTERLAARMARNILFSDLREQDRVATALEEVAATLRRGGDEMEKLARTLDEFIRRQEDINREVESALERTTDVRPVIPLAGTQRSLEGEVSEHAAALRWLARELDIFDLRTPGMLDSAAGEMRGGAEDLASTRLDEALEHGRAALERLKEARGSLASDRARMARAAEAQGMPPLEALLLLRRLLSGQKRVNRGTAEADAIRAEQPEHFRRAVISLAGRQSSLRLDALRLAHFLAPFPGAASLAGTAGGKMERSGELLTAGETGRVTRIVQREIVALLEKLLESQKASCRAAGQAGIPALTLMRMLGAAGAGYTGGTNAPVSPSAVDRGDDSEWYRSRAHFEGPLTVGPDERIPEEYRKLVDAYFDALRTIPPE